MNRRAALPTPDEVHDAITALTEALRKPPSALALAKHLGLANTTFRRHFPDIAADSQTHRINRTVSRGRPRLIAVPGAQTAQRQAPPRHRGTHRAPGTRGRQYPTTQP